ncbi:hypothetical protein D3C72_1763410 [compost metagenome]
MAQAIAYRAQLLDGAIHLIGLVLQPGPIDGRPTFDHQHPGDIVEGKSGAATERDQRQALDHRLVEHPLEAIAADGADQPLLLVVAQRGGRQAGPARHLSDIHLFHA